MARHAADLEAVIEALELPRAILLGHSMGAFVAVVAASRYPDRFSEVFLIDGGLPLAIPAGMSKEDLVGATIGSAVRRLSMTFPDRAAYLDFWKNHPAFADNWSQAVADYDCTTALSRARSLLGETSTQTTIALRGGCLLLLAVSLDIQMFNVANSGYPELARSGNLVPHCRSRQAKVVKGLSTLLLGPDGREDLCHADIPH